MPSGSRGGGGGSHGGSRGGSSGGSRSGGSHGGGSIRFITHTRTRHSIKLRTRPGRPDRYFDIDAIHSVVCVMLFILFMIFGSMACSASEEIEFLQEDYAYYQNMITVAESDPDTYIVDAYVTSYSYRADFGKYYINYSIPYTSYEYVHGYGYKNVNRSLAGYSFSVYTYEEARELYEERTIKVAVDMAKITSSTDSIPMDYRHMSIEQDGEYMTVLRSKTKNTSILICLGVFTVGWFTFFIIASNKVSKAYDKEEAENAKLRLNQKKTSERPATPDASHCQYCGTYLVKDNNIKCPACGATKTIKY